MGRKKVALFGAHRDVMNGSDSDLLELCAVGGCQVEQELASVIRQHEAPVELRRHLRADLIAATADAWADPGANVAWLRPEFVLHRLQGDDRDPGPRPAPPGMCQAGSAIDSIPQNDRETVRMSRSAEHTSELQSRPQLVYRLLLDY